MTNHRLTGIAIVVRGRRQFVGKVGIVPTAGHPKLAHKTIFYRTEPWDNVVLRAEQAVSVDRDAWDAARLYGVEGLVCYCPDTTQLILASTETVSGSPVSDYGERLEYRIPLADCTIWDDQHPLPMGYTHTVRTPDEIFQIFEVHRAAADRPVERDAQQLSVFENEQPNTTTGVNNG